MYAKTLHHGYVMWCTLILVSLGTYGVAATKEAKDIEVAALLHETQKTSATPPELTMVWWIPEEFWSAHLAQDPALISLSAREKQELLRAFRPYTIVMVVDGRKDPYGNIRFRSESSIRNDMRLIDMQGNVYAPLGESEIEADMRDMMHFLKWSLADFAGNLGQNTHVLLFPCETEAGTRIVQAKEKGQLRIALGNREFRWRLPLDSLLVDKVCSGCAEECKGSWDYCPWCGTKLGQP